MPVLRAFAEIGAIFRRSRDENLVREVAEHLRNAIPRDRASSDATRDEILSAVHEALYFCTLWKAGFCGVLSASRHGSPDIDLSIEHGIVVEFTDCRNFNQEAADWGAIADRCHSEALAKVPQVASFKPDCDLLRMIVIDLPAGCRAALVPVFQQFVDRLNALFSDFPQSYRVWLTLFDFGENEPTAMNRGFKIASVGLVLPPFPLDMSDLRYVAFQSRFWYALGVPERGFASVPALDLLKSGAISPSQLSEWLRSNPEDVLVRNADGTLQPLSDLADGKARDP
jgi:hypothetical protein